MQWFDTVYSSTPNLEPITEYRNIPLALYTSDYYICIVQVIQDFIHSPVKFTLPSHLTSHVELTDYKTRKQSRQSLDGSDVYRDLYLEWHVSLL